MTDEDGTVHGFRAIFACEAPDCPVLPFSALRFSSCRKLLAPGLIALALLCAPVAAGQASVPPGVPLVFRAPFDGSASARLADRAIEAEEPAELHFAAEDEGSFIRVSRGTRLRYDLAPAFPGESGTLELLFRPEFAQDKDQPAGTLLTLTAGCGMRIAFGFHPAGVRWLFAATWKGSPWRREMIAWHGKIKRGEWNQVLLTWDAQDRDFALYHQGRWLRTQKYDRTMKGPVVLELTGMPAGTVAIDDVLVYSRAFTKGQAAAQFEAFSGGSDRFAALAARLAEDGRIAAERRALVSRLKGKVGRLVHDRGRKPGGTVAFPEGIVAECIRPEDIGKTDLSRFSVIHFPQGPRYQIEPEQYPAIVEYVENGGGYVGCCQGAYFAEKLGLLDMKCYAMNVWGLYMVRLRPHYVTDGRNTDLRMHFGNGPVMVPGAGCTILGTYLLGLPEEGEPAAILAGVRGKGRVVLFGTHPLGDHVSYQGTRAYFSGKLLGTERMFVNALLYAAGIAEE